MLYPSGDKRVRKTFSSGDRPALGTGNNAAQWVNGNFSAGMGVLGTVVATATYSTHSSSLVTWEMSDGVGNSG